MSATSPIQLQAWKGEQELSLRIPGSVIAAAFSLVTVCFASLSCKIASSYEHFTNRSEEFLGYRNAPQLRYSKFCHVWCWRSTSLGRDALSFGCVALDAFRETSAFISSLKGVLGLLDLDIK
jgi:hypothetical protein